MNQPLPPSATASSPTEKGGWTGAPCHGPPPHTLGSPGHILALDCVRFKVIWGRFELLLTHTRWGALARFLCPVLPVLARLSGGVTASGGGRACSFCWLPGAVHPASRPTSQLGQAEGEIPPSSRFVFSSGFQGLDEARPPWESHLLSWVCRFKS